MRAVLAVMFVAALPLSVAAQSGTSGLAPIGLGLSPIGLGLSPIGLPLGPIGLPPASAPAGAGSDRPPAMDHQPRPGRGRHLRPSSIVYFPPVYWDPWPAPEPSPPVVYAPAPEPRSTMGALRLDVQPSGPHEVHVDGYYIGTLDEFAGEIPLEAGPHRLEVRAEGYEPFPLAVQITAQRVLTYRASLKADPSAPAADRDRQPEQPGRATPPTVIYLIPGCYLGNVPPEHLALPKGCDPSRVIISK